MAFGHSSPSKGWDMEAGPSAEEGGLENPYPPRPSTQQHSPLKTHTHTRKIYIKERRRRGKREENERKKGGDKKKIEGETGRKTREEREKQIARFRTRRIIATDSRLGRRPFIGLGFARLRPRSSTAREGAPRAWASAAPPTIRTQTSTTPHTTKVSTKKTAKTRENTKNNYCLRKTNKIIMSVRDACRI